MPRRQVLELEGVGHAAPIPMGVRMGNMVFTSAVMGTDPSTSELPDDPERQAEMAFANVASLLKEAGGSTADIAKMTVYVKNNEMRPHVNKHWLAWYPSEDDRPVRHIVPADLQGKMLIQLEVIAVLDGGQ